MPGFYADGEYDLAGFIIGIVDRSRVIDGGSIRPGDVLIGLSSSGLHTNGYSLARRIVFDTLGLRVDTRVDEFGGAVGEELLKPHRSYLHVIEPLLDTRLIKGMAHITGGGLTDNMPRILPEGTAVEIERASWDVPPVFAFLQRHGRVPADDMYRTFNMGIGLVIVCGADAVTQVRRRLAERGEPKARIIGRVVEGDGKVNYI